ncbi:MAG: hypothetical protein WDO19_15005 [Bacteroidota bacterium]
MLGWEAGIIVQHALKEGTDQLKNFSYVSPRGIVTLHAGTHQTYAPLYKGIITAAADDKCELQIVESLPVTDDEHERVLRDLPDEGSAFSGWKNNYFCM